MSPAKSWSGAKQCFHSESVNPRLGSTKMELTSVSFIPRPSAQPHPDASQALAQRRMPKPVDELLSGTIHLSPTGASNHHQEAAKPELMSEGVKE